MQQNISMQNKTRTSGAISRREQLSKVTAHARIHLLHVSGGLAAVNESPARLRVRTPFSEDLDFFAVENLRTRSHRVEPKKSFCIVVVARDCFLARGSSASTVCGIQFERRRRVSPVACTLQRRGKARRSWSHVARRLLEKPDCIRHLYSSSGP